MKQTFSERPAAKIVSAGPGVVCTTINYNIADNGDGTWSADSVTIETDGLATERDIRKAIIGIIDAQTDEKILNGFQWTILHGDEEGAGAGNTVHVKLDKENRENYSEMHRLATLAPSEVFPTMFKLGEDENGIEVFDTFLTFDELDAFYMSAAGYITQQYNDGFQMKKHINIRPYLDDEETA